MTFEITSPDPIESTLRRYFECLTEKPMRFDERELGEVDVIVIGRLCGAGLVWITNAYSIATKSRGLSFRLKVIGDYLDLFDLEIARLCSLHGIDDDGFDYAIPRDPVFHVELGIEGLRTKSGGFEAFLFAYRDREYPGDIQQVGSAAWSKDGGVGTTNVACAKAEAHVTVPAPVVNVITSITNAAPPSPSEDDGFTNEDKAIALLRKNQAISNAAIAKKLGITPQAVSKYKKLAEIRDAIRNSNQQRSHSSNKHRSGQKFKGDE